MAGRFAKHRIIQVSYATGNGDAYLFNSESKMQVAAGVLEGIIKSNGNNVPPDLYVLPSAVSDLYSDFTGGVINLSKEINSFIKDNKNEIKNKK